MIEFARTRWQHIWRQSSFDPTRTILLLEPRPIYASLLIGLFQIVEKLGQNRRRSPKGKTNIEWWSYDECLARTDTDILAYTYILLDAVPTGRLLAASMLPSAVCMLHSRGNIEYMFVRHFVTLRRHKAFAKRMESCVFMPRRIDAKHTTIDAYHPFITKTAPDISQGFSFLLIQYLIQNRNVPWSCITSLSSDLTILPFGLDLVLFFDCQNPISKIELAAQYSDGSVEKANTHPRLCE